MGNGSPTAKRLPYKTRSEREGFDNRIGSRNGQTPFLAWHRRGKALRHWNPGLAKRRQLTENNFNQSEQKVKGNREKQIRAGTFPTVICHSECPRGNSTSFCREKMSFVSSARAAAVSNRQTAKQSKANRFSFHPIFTLFHDPPTPLPSPPISQSVTSIPTFYQLICLTSLRHSLSHMTHHQTQIHKAYEPITISKTIGRTGEPPSHL